MKNYYLSYRPFHTEYALRISALHETQVESVIINHTTHTYDIPSSPGLSTYNIHGGLLQRLRLLRDMKNQLRREAKTGKNLQVFIPHTLGLMANYCYYRLAPRFSNLKINVFYEGVIVFYPYEHRYLPNMKHYVSRYLIGLAIGMRFTFDKRLLDLQSDRIAKIYTPFLNLQAPVEKLVLTPLRQIVYEKRNDVCVILGLKLKPQYDAEMKTIIRKMYDMVGALGIKTVYFKDHPYEKNPFFYQLASECQINLQPILEVDPIENIIDKFRPKFIFSLWSSGLVNLKSMLPEDIRVFSVVGKNVVDGYNLQELIRVFDQTGIEVVWS